MYLSLSSISGVEHTSGILSTSVQDDCSSVKIYVFPDGAINVSSISSMLWSISETWAKYHFFLPNVNPTSLQFLGREYPKGDHNEAGTFGVFPIAAFSGVNLR